MKKSLVTLAVLASATLITGCASGYKQGVAGNVLNYREFTDVMHSQQNTLNSCFNAAAASTEANAIALCAVLAASTNQSQVLTGQPEAIRVAKSPEEIMESIATRGLEAAVKVYGFKQISQVLGKGFDNAGKDPLIVRPEVVRPEVVNPIIVTP